MRCMWPLVLVGVALCSAPTGVFLQQDSYNKCGVDLDGDYDCRNNSLTRVPEGVPGNVTVVYLDTNNLISLGKKELLNKGYANIEGLYIRYNSITELDDEAFSGLTNLSAINLSGNNITVFSKDIISGNLEMKELHLGGNPIKLPDSEETPLLSSASLRSLRLSSSGWTRVTDGLFIELPNLKRLNLMVNRLTTINWRSVNHLNKLTEFILNGNDIRRLTCRLEIVLPLSELNNVQPGSQFLNGSYHGTFRVIYLIENPIECDCCFALMNYGLRKMSWKVQGMCNIEENTGLHIITPELLEQCYNTTMEEYNTSSESR